MSYLAEYINYVITVYAPCVKNANCIFSKKWFGRDEYAIFLSDTNSTVENKCVRFKMFLKLRLKTIVVFNWTLCDCRNHQHSTEGSLTIMWDFFRGSPMQNISCTRNDYACKACLSLKLVRYQSVCVEHIVSELQQGFFILKPRIVLPALYYFQPHILRVALANEKLWIDTVKWNNW